MNLTKNKIFLIMLVFAAFIIGCEKLKVERINKITTNDVTVNSTTVQVTSNILDIAKDGITEYGHCIYKANGPKEFLTKYTGATKGQFTDTLKNIDPNTTYYAESYFKKGEEITYGESKSFTISPNGILFQNSTLIFLSKSSVKIKANISNVGSLKASDYGICWNTIINPVITNNPQNFGNINTNKSLEVSINGLLVKTKYYARPFMKFADESVIYGNNINIYIPDLTVSTISYLLTGSTTATLRGKIDTLGIPPTTDYGFCISNNNSNPNLNDTKYSLGTTSLTGEFTKSLTGITQGLRYYFRAYAMEENNIKYGTVMSFQIN